MGKYIEDAIAQITKKFNEAKNGNDVALREYQKELKAAQKEGRAGKPPEPVEEHVVIRFETTSGDPDPRRMKILEVYDDYFVGQSRTKSAPPETFAFAHITNWRFESFNPDEWKG